MGFLLALILMAIAEVWTAIQVAHHIGWLATVAVLVLISACGPYLVRRQGIGVWRRARGRLEYGEVPGREAIDGVLLLIAGVLLTVPGFLTGLLGALLLLPPVRSLVRTASGVWLARKVERSSMTIRTSVGGHRDLFGPGGTVTAESHPVERRRRSLDSPPDTPPPAGDG